MSHSASMYLGHYAVEGYVCNKKIFSTLPKTSLPKTSILAENIEAVEVRAGRQVAQVAPGQQLVSRTSIRKLGTLLSSIYYLVGTELVGSTSSRAVGRRQAAGDSYRTSRVVSRQAVKEVGESVEPSSQSLGQAYCLRGAREGSRRGQTRGSWVSMIGWVKADIMLARLRFLNLVSRRNYPQPGGQAGRLGGRLGVGWPCCIASSLCYIYDGRLHA